MHEINCQYEPVACDRCQAYVIKERMQDHFDDVHCLGNKNSDVKFADFYLESTGSRKIKCVTNRGLIVYFTLLNVNSVQLNSFAVLYPVTELNVSVKLDFTKQGYAWSCSDAKLPNYLDIDHHTMSFIDIEENIFNDWVNGESKLDIEVAVRKKRQVQGQQKETVAKKAKAVKIEKMKNELRKLKETLKKRKKQFKDENTLRSHKTALTQKMRDEYLKKTLEANPNKEC